MASQEHTERDFLKCTICLDILKEPKTLTCLHRFCESCLHTHIISSVKSASYSVRSFSCPLCRISISVPNYLTPPSTWASQFRTDFDVKGIIELVQSRKELPETNVPKIKYPECSKHMDKECGFYCMDCGQTCCETCAVINHRACNLMVTVEDAAKDRRAALRPQINDISSKIDQAVELESLREDCMRNIEDMKEQIEHTIIESAMKLRQLVSSEEEKLLKYLDKKYDGLQEEVSLTVSNFEETVNNARSAVKNASTKSDFDLLSNNSCVDALVSCDITNATVEHTRFCKKLSEVKCCYQKDSVPDITLGKCSIFYDLSDHDISANSKSACNNGGSSPNLATPTVVPENPEKRTYAKICIVGKPKETPVKACAVTAPKSTEMTSNKPEVTLPIITPDDPALPVNKIIRTIKARYRHDIQTPCLNSIIVLALTDTILATDSANNSVKVLPNQRGKNKCLRLNDCPSAITQVSESSVAVSLPLSQQICFIKVSPDLAIDRYIKVSKSYQGLASFISLDSVIIVAGSSQNSARNVASVDLLNISGQVLKSFTQDSSGLPLFSDPAYLCVTPDKMIVVSDVGYKTVKYVTLDGEPKFSYPPEEAEPLQNPKGVACDPSGGIFLVEGGDLLALTSDGQLKKTLISSKDRSLCISGAVAVDKSLYVVDNEEHIQVFRTGRTDICGQL